MTGAMYRLKNVWLSAWENHPALLTKACAFCKTTKLRSRRRFEIFLASRRVERKFVSRRVVVVVVKV